MVVTRDAHIASRISFLPHSHMPYTPFYTQLQYTTYRATVYSVQSSCFHKQLCASSFRRGGLWWWRARLLRPSLACAVCTVHNNRVHPVYNVKSYRVFRLISHISIFSFFISMFSIFSQIVSYCHKYAHGVAGGSGGGDARRAPRRARLLRPSLSCTIYTVHHHRIHTIYTVNSYRILSSFHILTPVYFFSSRYFSHVYT